jgi:K+-sensing histidine kinase KdpD
LRAWIAPLQKASEGELAISIIDTGIGIAASDLDRIFEPFTQAESSMSGDMAAPNWVFLFLVVSRKTCVAV